MAIDSVRVQLAPGFKICFWIQGNMESSWKIKKQLQSRSTNIFKLTKVGVQIYLS